MFSSGIFDILRENEMTYALTLIGAKGLDDNNLADIRDILSVETIVEEQVLSADKAIDIILNATPANEELAAIKEYVHARDIDYALQAVETRKKKLIVADMESTVIENEFLDVLADFLNLQEEVSAITEEGMQGKIDFHESINKRVALLKGLPKKTLDEAMQQLKITDGAKTLVATMRANGAKTALISSGFLFFIEQVSESCNFDYHRGNDFIIEDGLLTGEVKMPILDKTSKKDALVEYAKEHGFDIAHTMAVGDGANDLCMIKEAGTGVAFQTVRPSSNIDAESDVAIKFNDLTALLYLQGYKEADFIQ